MSDYESLSILVSLISACVALWAIIVSRKTANEQKNIAHRTQLLESRNLIATHLAKYSELLSSVQSQTKQCKEELAEAAYDAHQKLCLLLPALGKVQLDHEKHPRQTRHIFYDASERLYQAFSPHLLRRSGGSIYIRYNRLRNIVDSSELGKSEIEKLKRDEKIENIHIVEAYSKDADQELEYMVIQSSGFRLLVQQLLVRIPAKERPLIFQEALRELNPFLVIYERAQKSFASAQQELEDGLAKNELEEFSLKESPLLYEAYKKEVAKLDIFQNLDLLYFRDWSDMEVKDSIPELIHIGSVLFTIYLHEDWGNLRRLMVRQAHHERS